MVKRPYRSAIRRAQAESTRSKILDAALKLFADEGYAMTTIAAIAREAGLAPETIYAAFRSKRGIIDGLIAAAAPADIVANIQGAWAAKAGDPAAQLAFLARFATEFWSRNDALAAIFRQGTGDAEIGDEWAKRQVARRDLFGAALVDWPGGVLRPGVTPDRAADLVWALASDELFHLLVRQRGWSIPRFRTWLTQALQHELLADPPASLPSGR